MDHETVARLPGDSGSAAAHLAEGLALRGKRRLKAAVACFEQAVAADPAITEGWFWLAVTRDNRAQEAEAIPAYRQALRLGIKDRNQRAQAWTWLASSLSKTGRHAEALDALTEAVRLGGYEPKDEFGRLRVTIGRRTMRAQQRGDKDRSELRADHPRQPGD